MQNQPRTSQTTHKASKPHTNQPKIASFFYLKTFFMNRNIFLVHSAREEKWVHFSDVPARFRISPSPFHSSLPSLIVDYYSSHKLLTQLRTLTNFSRRLGLYYIIYYDITLKVLWVLAPLKSPHI